jgi:hypothetical protein
LYYDGDDAADIIADLLENYAGVDPDYIPLTEWQAETAANLGVIYARAITEPTAVGKLVSELVEQAALAVWWDERARIARLHVLKEIATDAHLFDEGVIMEGTLKVRDQPSKRISQIWTYYGQRNPADRGDNEDNYRAALADVDLERQGEYGSPIVRKIIGKWVATINAAERLNQVQLSRFRDPPRKFNFDLFHGSNISPGGGYRLRWRQNQNMDGTIVQEGAPIQVTRVSVEPGVIHVEAEEMLASGVVVLTHTVILTETGTGKTWTVPADWNDADNSIHCIGAGGGGGRNIGGGGAGGAYSGIVNLALTPSSSAQYRVGSGGSGATGGSATAGGDTWFNGANLGASSVGAKGGSAGASNFANTNASGGQASSGIGTVKTNGGNGGAAQTGGDDADEGGGGGGGAGGPNGNGRSGGNCPFNSRPGAGGGAANGGSSGKSPVSTAGGKGGNNRFSFGGGGDTSPTGQDGGGGRGCDGFGGGGIQSGPGGAGEQMWTQTITPIFSAGPGGGGGGGGWNIGGGAAGGLYGGGGGGGSSGFNGASGAQGVIVITWRPAV